MKMAGFYDESISNGLGWRAVLFCSGCPHHCPNCQNLEAQDFNYGQDFNEDEIINKIRENSIIKGVTLSGGEPLCMQNISDELHFVKRLKQERPNLNVWCYTGYTYEELKNRNDDTTNELLNNIDVLVDGRFVESKKDPDLMFRGSSNQRVLDIPKCLKENKIVEVSF